MSKPEFQSDGGTYRFVWAEKKIGIEMSRFREKGGDVWAELTVKTLLPGVPPHLGQEKLNLCSSRARNTFAKSLNERLEIDWSAILEQACVIALNTYREGEPVRTFSWDDPVEPVEYLLHPFLPKLQPTAIYGDGGVGKSQLSLFFATLLGKCWGDNPYHLGTTDSPVSTLILDWETDWNYHRWTLRRLLSGYDKEEIPIHYRRCMFSLSDELPAIQSKVAELGIGLVVIDSAAMACGGDPSSPETVITFFRALRQLPVTSLIIAHNAKNSEGKTIFGSVFWHNSCRAVWELRKSNSDDGDALDMGLFCKKANMSKMFPPIGFRFAFIDDDMIMVSPQDVSKVPELAVGLPMRRQIALVLENGSMSVEDIASELDVPKANITTTLNRNKAMFTKVGNEWGNLASEEI